MLIAQQLDFVSRAHLEVEVVPASRTRVDAVPTSEGDVAERDRQPPLAVLAAHQGGKFGLSLDWIEQNHPHSGWGSIDSDPPAVRLVSGQDGDLERTALR
jgi:hypothetical protein